MESGPIDPNAPTRTVLPGGSDAATDEGADPDRTRSSGDQTQASAIGTPGSGGDRARRPAPLQYRDPERYEVIAEHGRGGLGRVMRARDRELGRPVAIKEMLHPGLTSELRFFREALITARLEHPGIVPVHEAGRWPDGTPFYAMKLVAGRPLKAVIEEATSLEARLALLPHVIAVSDAVAYAHSRGIIHRDLKPSNVIVGDFGETVVIDWGLAKDVAEPEDAPPSDDAPAAPGLTVAGTVLGTPGYMSPEQAAGTADTRSDIFAIGALLSHVLHGHAPEGASGAPATPPPRSTTKVPPALLAVVAKATASDPAQRYATARALGDDLRQFQSGKLVDAHRYSLAQLVHHWASHNRRLVVLSLAALIVMSVTLGTSAVRIVSARNAATAAGRRAEAGVQALTLSNARNAVTRDPTQALLWLRTYEGPEVLAAQDIAAEALARGVARFGLHEHADAITRLQSTGDTSFLSASRDGDIRRWTIRGDSAESTLVATGANGHGTFAVTGPTEHVVWLAYGGELRAEEPSTSGRLITKVDSRTTWIETSADGQHAVLLVDGGGVVCVDLSKPDQSRLLAERRDLLAVEWRRDPSRLVVVTKTHGLQIWDRCETLVVDQPLAGVTAASIGATIVLLQDADGNRRTLGPDLRRSDVTSTAAVPGCMSIILGNTSTMFASRCGRRLVVTRLDTGVVAYDETFLADISAVTFSPDDRWIGFGMTNGDVVAVSTATWGARTFLGHSAAIHSDIAFVGDSMVSGDGDGDVRVWPLSDAVHSVSIDGSDLRRVTASPDGELFATDSAAGIVRLWTSKGTLLKELRGHDGVIPSISFSSDGTSVLTPGWDATVRVWPVGANGEPAVMRGHAGRVMVARTVGGDIASVGHDGRLIVWRDGSPTVIQQDDDGYTRMDVQGTTIAVGGGSGRVFEVNAATGLTRLTTRHERQVDAVAYSPDARWLVTADLDGVVDVFDRQQGRLLPRQRLSAALVGLAISSTSRLLAVATADRRLRLFEIGPEGVALQATRDMNVKRLAFAPTGERLAAICADGMVRFWDLEGSSASAFELPRGIPMGIAFGKGGTTIGATTAEGMHVAEVAAARAVPARLVAIRELIDRVVARFDAPAGATPEERRFLYRARNR